MFKKTKTRTYLSSRCVAFRGVNLWNKFEDTLKMYNVNIRYIQYRKMFRNNVLMKYVFVFMNITLFS